MIAAAPLFAWLSDQVLAYHRVVCAAVGWRRAAVAGVAGALSNLAFAPFFAWLVMFVTVPALVWLIDSADQEGHVRAGVMRAFASGWWFGFGFFFFGLFWIGEAFLVEADKFAWALPFAVTLMPAGLALFFATACAAARLVWSPGLDRLIVLAVALACAEWLRGNIFTGFPWNSLGYSLTAPLVLMQSAGLVGIYSLGLWALLIFAAPVCLLCEPADRVSRLRSFGLGLLIAIVPLVAFAGYGAWRLSLTDPGVVESVRLRIVQPSILQAEKWQPDKQSEIFQKHLDLSVTNPDGRYDGLAGITHVLWAEASMPFLPLEQPAAQDRIGDMLPDGVLLLAGALRRSAPTDQVPRWRAYNSLMVFNDRGELTELYDKTHLVPFGEYLPFPEVLEAIGLENLTRQRGGFTPGPEPRPLLTTAGLPAPAVLICYEAIFPHVGSTFAGDPQLYLNATNDGWFGNTTGPHQHFHQNRVRAVEEGVPLIRVANNGVSAVVDGRGRVRHRLGLNEVGVIDSDVPKPVPPPLVARFGDWIFLGHLIVFGLVAFGLRRRADR